MKLFFLTLLIFAIIISIIVGIVYLAYLLGPGGFLLSIALCLFFIVSFCIASAILGYNW